MIGGCSFYKGAVDQSMEINRSAAKGDLESMFLNILRASKHRPPVFTAMTDIEVSAPSMSSSVNLELPFGGGGSNAYKLTPGVSSSYGLSYKVSILQSQDFMRGFLSPIDPHQFKYYWDMGWPKSLLLNLFVKEIKYFTITYGNNGYEKITQDHNYENYPMDKKKFTDFNREVNKMLYNDSLMVLYGDQDWKEASTSVPKKIYKKDQKKNDKDVEGKIHKTIIFVFSGGGQDSSYARKKDYLVTLPPEIKDSKMRKILHIDENKKLVKFAVFYLRSAEAVLYYLGEIVRIQNSKNEDGFTPCIYTEYDTDCESLDVFLAKSDNKKKIYPIFLARTASEAKSLCLGLDEGDSAYNSCDLQLSVNFMGDKWVIPDYREAKSLEVLSLLSQLIGLNKNEKDLPKTSTLRIIP